jgi:hypothetical protein
VQVKLRAGVEIDDWRLISPLGRGGNGEVWRAEHPHWGEVALKLLSSKKGDRRQRFSDEIAVLRELGDHPGVLPLIAAKLPDDTSKERAWLAAPVAEEVAEALGAESALVEVVQAIHAYAVALADLGTRGIGHRDIKPGNLFRYDDRWVIGDFGLVTYPEKQPVTTTERRLGPLFFMAPEMLRQPDIAKPGPADVYSLAKTLWVLATDQTYPPEGQVRADAPDHSLGRWTQAPGTLSLTLILERATDPNPDQRPSAAQFAGELETWMKGGAVQDDHAAQHIRQRYVEKLGDSLAEALDETSIAEIEKQLKETLPQARRQAADRRDQLRMQAIREAEDKRQQLVREGNVKQVLNVLESAWIGRTQDGVDFAESILAKPVKDRTKELEQTRRILWGRPLWWLHTVILIGCLRLRGQEGCEPIASELAGQEARNHLLEFKDEQIWASLWRLQRALIPATARITALMPLRQLEEAAKAVIPAEQRLRYNFDQSRLLYVLVSEIVRTRLREINPWTAEALVSDAEEAEKMLARLPIPPGPWLGPIGDPWLQSWQRFSPLVMCGLTALNEDPTGDDFLDANDLRPVVLSAATGEFEVLRRPAVPLAQRLGLL